MNVASVIYVRGFQIQMQIVILLQIYQVAYNLCCNVWKIWQSIVDMLPQKPHYSIMIVLQES